MNWKIWAHGLGAAFIGGGAAVIAGGIAGGHWRQALITAATAGAINAAAYLMHSPLADLNTSATNLKSETQESPNGR